MRCGSKKSIDYSRGQSGIRGGRKGQKAEILSERYMRIGISELVLRIALKDVRHASIKKTRGPCGMHKTVNRFCNSRVVEGERKGGGVRRLLRENRDKWSPVMAIRVTKFAEKVHSQGNGNGKGVKADAQRPRKVESKT